MFEVDGIHWWPGPGAGGDAASLAALVEDAVGQWRGGRLEDWKRDPSKHMYRLKPADGHAEGEVLLKVRSYHGAQRLRRRVVGSKARRELEMASHLARAGIATPLPLAAGEERVAGLVQRDFLLLPYLDGARDLKSLAAAEIGARERRALATALGALTRQLEHAGVFQEDFAPNNFLVAEPPAAGLQAIDFERAHLRAVREADIVFSAAKMLRELPRARALDRRAFVAALRPGARDQARTLWRAVAAELPRQAERDLIRLRRVVSRSGRRFRRERSGGAELLVSRELDSARLEEVLRDDSGILRRPLVDATAAAAREHLARAELLHHRGLGPAPLLVSVAREGAWIGFRQPPRPAPPGAAARASLIRGLLAIGRLPGPPDPASVVGSEGGEVALLLDGSLLEVGVVGSRPAIREILRSGA